MTAQIPNPAKLREAIAETLWGQVSAHDLAHVCDALGMPPAGEGIRAWDSKRRYVRSRLVGQSAADVADMARAVPEQYDDPKLLALISPAELRGVEGELKNLIFAAHGPKLRIVLRDAINNVIEIVEHADTCLVYDRPLTAGLSWGELVSWWRETAARAGSNPARSLYSPSASVDRQPGREAAVQRVRKLLRPRRRRGGAGADPSATCTTTRARSGSWPGATARRSGASGWTS